MSNVIVKKTAAMTIVTSSGTNRLLPRIHRKIISTDNVLTHLFCTPDAVDAALLRRLLLLTTLPPSNFISLHAHLSLLSPVRPYIVPFISGKAIRL